MMSIFHACLTRCGRLVSWLNIPWIASNTGSFQVGRSTSSSIIVKLTQNYQSQTKAFIYQYLGRMNHAKMTRQSRALRGREGKGREGKGIRTRRLRLRSIQKPNSQSMG